MIALALVGGLGLALLLLLRWACVTLPAEGWQFAASVPHRRGAGTSWRAGNITFYGVLLALAMVVAGGVWVMLMGAAGIEQGLALAMLAAMMAVALPSAKLVARVVERRRHTFTVGGAVFASILVAPAVVAALGALLGGPSLPALLPPALAAMAVAFLFGEGLGRLGCISFGCCYGRPVHTLGPLGRRVFSRAHFIFRGATKKAAYDADLEGVPVVPIQAMTAAVLLAGGLAAMWLHLQGLFRASFLLAVLLSQGWRFASEGLRSDDRGAGRLSAYQWMALAGVAWAGAVAAAVGRAPGVASDVVAGLIGLWNPLVIVALQGLGIVTLALTGWSRVTGATLRFHCKSEAAAPAVRPARPVRPRRPAVRVG